MLSFFSWLDLALENKLIYEKMLGLIFDE